jgi:WD40 repeat protein
VEKTIPFDGILIRAIDIMGSKGLVGLRNGTIYEIDVGSGSKREIMKGHSDGETWGLAVADASHVVTSGDDNKIINWNIKTRKAEAVGTISNESRKAPKGGASSLTELPNSQCARAVAVGSNGHVAVGHNDGSLTVRAGIDKLD